MSVTTARTIEGDEVSITTSVTEQVNDSMESYIEPGGEIDCCETAKQMGERLIEIHEDLYEKYRNYK